MLDIIVVFLTIAIFAIGIIAIVVSIGDKKFYPLSLIVILGLLLSIWFLSAVTNRQKIEIGVYDVQIIDNVPIIVIDNCVYNVATVFNRNIEAGTKIKVTNFEQYKYGVLFTKSGHQFKIVSPEAK